MADAYCGLQKSIRSGQLHTAIYWAGQIGNNLNGLKGYPNALKKRLCQISLEDGASWEYASRLFTETKSNNHANFMELLPWVVALVQLPKTHSTAWLQRVAAQYVYEGGKVVTNQNDFSITTTNEIEFAASCLVAYHDENQDFLRNACGDDSVKALAIYKYINNDPLVYHAWQMHQRRPEIRNREINIVPLSDIDLSPGTLESILSTRLELPDMWYDKHTKKGKKMGRGYEHFFEIMVFHPRLYPLPEGVVPSARDGSEPYEVIAKKLYLDFRIDGAEVKSKQLLSVRRSSTIPKFLNISEDGTCSLREDLEDMSNSSKRSAEDEAVEDKPKSKKAKTSGGNSHSALPTNSLHDEAIFDFDSGCRFLGFKNITCICKLKSPLLGLDGLNPGDDIFFKLGESFENCQFASSCEKYKHELGMVNFYGKSIVQYVTLSKNYPLMVTEQHPNWSQSISKHFKSSIQKYSLPSSDSTSTSLPTLPVLITGVFDGIRLCDGLDSLTDGMKLLQILLFRKYFGINDTNATNIMINTSSGDLYSVDENPAGDDKLASYMTKGLITSQKLHSQLCMKAGNVILTHPHEVGSFIRRLKRLELGVEILPHRLEQIHAACPFDDATIELLSNDGDGNDKELKKLISKLKLQYKE